MDKWYRMDALRNITGPYDMNRIRELTRLGRNFHVGGSRLKDWLSVETLPGVVGNGGAAGEDGGEAAGTELLDRGINELIGLCKGIISDGFVDAKEVDFLQSWLEHNADVAANWPANVLAERIDRILADGVADEIERTDLSLLISRLTGVRPGIADAEQLATRLPVDEPPPEVTFKGRSFHLTGNFVLGPRAECEARMEALGGVCQDQPAPDLEYLVIGALGSPDWAYGPYGKEIQAVLRYREEGAETAILSEEHWTFYLTQHTRAAV